MSESPVAPSGNSMTMLRGLEHFMSLFTPRQRPGVLELKSQIMFLDKQISLTRKIVSQLSKMPCVPFECGVLSIQFLHLREAYAGVATRWQDIGQTMSVSDRAEVQGAFDSLQKAMSQIHSLYREALFTITYGLTSILALPLMEQERNDHDQITKLVEAKCLTEKIEPEGAPTKLMIMISEEIKLLA